MYWKAYKAVVLIIKPIVFWSCRCRSCLRSLLACYEGGREWSATTALLVVSVAGSRAPTKHGASHARLQLDSLPVQEEQTQRTRKYNQTLIPGVLTIYNHQPGGNLLHENKALKFDVVGEPRATKVYPSQFNRLKRVASPQLTAHFFWSFPNGMVSTRAARLLK